MKIAVGLSRTSAGYLTSSLRYFDPSFTYPLTHKVFSTIRTVAPPVGTLPLSEETVTAIAVTMCLGGNRGCGLACLLCYSALLRIGECLKATWQHLYLPDPWSSTQQGSLFLPDTKAGRDAYVPLLDPGLVALLRHFRSRGNFRPTDRIFNFSYNSELHRHNHMFL